MVRTTVNLDDVVALVRGHRNDRSVPVDEAINDLIRAGSDRPTQAPVRTRTADLGVSPVDLDRALSLAEELEDDELIRKAGARTVDD